MSSGPVRNRGGSVDLGEGQGTKDLEEASRQGLWSGSCEEEYPTALQGPKNSESYRHPQTREEGKQGVHLLEDFQILVMVPPLHPRCSLQPG